MFTFLLWCLLFVLCWPLALSARVAAASAIQNCWNCRTRSVRASLGSRNVASKTSDCAIPVVSVGSCWPPENFYLLDALRGGRQPQFLHHHLQIFPGLFFLSRIAQQKRG